MSQAVSRSELPDYLALPTPKRTGRVLHALRRTVLPFVLILGGWELFVHFSQVNPELFPSVETTAARVCQTSGVTRVEGELLASGGQTAVEGDLERVQRGFPPHRPAFP
ncbi:hypothetical protein HFP15_06565, partial [Amycolatopsis sp. K13G38]